MEVVLLEPSLLRWFHWERQVACLPLVLVSHLALQRHQHLRFPASVHRLRPRSPSELQQRRRQVIHFKHQRLPQDPPVAFLSAVRHRRSLHPGPFSALFHPRLVSVDPVHLRHSVLVEEAPLRPAALYFNSVGDHQQDQCPHNHPKSVLHLEQQDSLHRIRSKKSFQSLTNSTVLSFSPFSISEDAARRPIAKAKRRAPKS